MRPRTSTPEPTSRPFVRERARGPIWYAKWSRDGHPVMRSLGPAWMESDGKGEWRPRRGRAREGALTEAAAAERMLELVRAHHVDASQVEVDASERRRRGITFRELGQEWLDYLEHEKGVKPSTLTGYRGLLGEPGVPHLRGKGESAGQIMQAFGDQPAIKITTREVANYLRGLERGGASARKVNRHQQVISWTPPPFRRARRPGRRHDSQRSLAARA